MATRTGYRSMLNWTRVKTVLHISFPIMAGMMSQNLLNLADTAMVGRLGPVDLAAVGIGGVAMFLCTAAMLSLSPAVQAMAARRKGEGEDALMAIPLNAGLVVAVGVGVPLSILLLIFMRDLFPLLTHDAEVATIGTAYMRARVLSLGAIGINFAFRGYWNGISRSRQYMITLTTMNVVNIVLNYTFIFGKWGCPQLGAVGAGLASCIATFVGSLMYLESGIRLSKPNGFLTRQPDRKVYATLLRLACPSAIQQVFYAGGVTALFWIIGLVGTVELAAANIIVTMYLLGVMPCIGSGLAAASLVGQALGRGDSDDAYRWGIDIVIMTAALMAILAIPMICFPCTMLRLFTPSQEVIDAGCGALVLAWIGLPIQSVALVLNQGLMGAGDNTRVMFVSIGSQWGVLLPGAYLAGPILGLGLTAIWSVQILYRTIQSLIFGILWHGTHWRNIDV